MNEKGRPKSWERVQWREHLQEEKFGEWFQIAGTKVYTVRLAAAELGYFLITHSTGGRIYGAVTNGIPGTRESHQLMWKSKVIFRPEGGVDLVSPDSENKPPAPEKKS